MRHLKTGLAGAIVSLLLVVAVGHPAGAAAGNSKCSADYTKVAVAVIAYSATHDDGYPTMKQLVKAGLLKAPSKLHKIKLLGGGSDYKLLPVKGKCSS